jgi:hypothetical protein
MDVCAPDFYELLQEIEFNFFVRAVPCGHRLSVETKVLGFAKRKWLNDR